MQVKKVLANERTKSGWQAVADAMGLLCPPLGYEAAGNGFYHGDGISFGLAPLERLEDLPERRKKQHEYQAPIILLVAGPNAFPSRKNLKFDPDENKNLFGNPKFDTIAQAVFRAERIRTDDADGPPAGPPYGLVNCINIMANDPAEKLQAAVARLQHDNMQKTVRLMGEFRERFYTTFIGYYDCVELTDTSVRSIVAKVENILLHLTRDDRDVSHATHHTPKEFIRAPLSFYLQDLAEAVRYLNDKVVPGRPLRLLLLDNLPPAEKQDDGENKFLSVKAPKTELSTGPLCELLLKKSKIVTSLEISMLGSIICRNSDKNTIAVRANGKDGEEFRDATKADVKQDLAFSADAFRGLARDSAGDYRARVFEAVKEAHFVLLDFFLNKDNTYLAFDFIEETSKIKTARNDHSTIWYFIASAVHDSVTRYAQSGLLAEYYESAVVNAGDDPTNDKRKIIFLYKLLTFINARIKSSLRHHEFVTERFLRPGEAGKPDCCRICCDNTPDSAKIRNQCFADTQRAVSRFLAEDEDFMDLLLPDYSTFARIFRLLDRTIGNFITLPQADWQIIQRQIDFIRAELGRLKPEEGKKYDFGCRYIREETRRRSERF